MNLDELKIQVQRDLKIDDEHLDTESLKNQKIAFATGVPPNIYAFHRYTRNSTYLSCTPARQFPEQSGG